MSSDYFHHFCINRLVLCVQNYRFILEKPNKTAKFIIINATVSSQLLPKIYYLCAVMKKTFIAIGLLLGIVLTGCDNASGNHQMDYKVTCTLDNKLHRDSATLMVLEEDYHKLRVCGTAVSSDGTFTFTGQTDAPKVALIRWDNDSTKPFHFVLEPGNTTITIKPDSWDIGGSALNIEYQRFVNQRNGIMNARVATWQEYLKMAADSTLKRDDERRMVRQDSLLNDSLQRITVDRINRGDAVGHIIRERFGNQLDQEHKRQIK